VREPLQEARKFHALVRKLREASAQARRRAAQAKDVTQSDIRDSEVLIRRVKAAALIAPSKTTAPKS